METELIKHALDYGIGGFFIAYLIWDRLQTARVAKERIAADLETARALERLAERIKT